MKASKEIRPGPNPGSKGASQPTVSEPCVVVSLETSLAERAARSVGSELEAGLLSLETLFLPRRPSTWDVSG